MNDQEKKDFLKTELSKKMNDIAADVTKKLINESEKSKKTDTKDKTIEIEDQKLVKKKTDAKAEPNEGNESKELLKVISSLQGQITDLSKKFDEGVKSTEDVATESLVKKQDSIKSGMVDLVKSMGIDPNNVDVNFVIKEKKKSTVDDGIETNDKFKKDIDSNSNDFEKEWEKLDEKEQKEASDLYFKQLLE